MSRLLKRCVLRERTQAADRVMYSAGKTVLDVLHSHGVVSAACWDTDRTFPEHLQPRVDFREMAEYQQIQQVHRETREHTSMVKRARRKELEARIRHKDKERECSRDKHSSSVSRAVENPANASADLPVVRLSRTGGAGVVGIGGVEGVERKETPSLSKLLQKHLRYINLEGFYEYKERLIDTKKLQREVDSMTVTLVNKSEKKRHHQILDDVQGMITKQVDSIESEVARREKEEHKAKRAQSAAASALSERLFRTQLDARGVSALPYNPPARKMTQADIEVSSPLLKKVDGCLPKSEELKNALDLPLSVIESRAESQAAMAWRQTIRSLKRKKPKARKRLDPSLSILA